MTTAIAGGSAPQAAAIRKILASRKIERVAVLGANGAMGSGSASLFTTVVPHVAFLARDRAKAEKGLDAAVKSVRSNTVRLHASVGDYGADFDKAVGEADLIFEAVAEDFAIKDETYARIDAVRRPDSIVATVSSGLSINDLAAKRSESFRRNFLGLHFFNPPSVIVGTEIIPGKETDPAVVDFVEAFATKRLGRVTIRTADRPGFAGNRVGFKVLNECAQLAEEHGPVLIDKLIGPYTGRALTPLATIDLVGWDVHRAIVDNIHANAPDEAHATLKLPDYMAKLMAKGVLGTKSGGGFFKRGPEKERLALDVDSGEYVSVKQAKLPDLGFVADIAFMHRIGEYREAMRRFATAPGEYAALARKVVAGYVAYAFERVGEVTETIEGIDLIMGCGFNWAPPSVLVDTIGLKATVGMIEEAGLKVPAILADELKKGRTAPFFADPRVEVGKFFVAG